jgi:anti-sigma-K factor RskA
MIEHEQFADDLALYALGSLEGEERVALEKHLSDCAACRRELEALRGDLAVLALSVPLAAPPPQARQRLLKAIAKEPRRAPASPARQPRSWWGLAPSLAVAALAVITLVFGLQNANMRRDISKLEYQNAEELSGLMHATEIVQTLTDANAAHFTLSAAQTPPRPQGKAIYARDRHSLIFLASNMPALPPQKIYELWLIPVSGAPIPSGLFTPDAHGSATVLNPPLPSGVEAKTFAVTMEPQEGSAAPTSTPIMVGAGG